MDLGQWRRDVELARAQKDRFFASHPQSPLPPEQRRAFQGLAYWPPNPVYRFEIGLCVHDTIDVIRLADGAGRYMDLEPGGHLTSNGTWIVDLNQAYNPWCAYSDSYVCPFVPSENRLDVLIRAGKKRYLRKSR